MTTTPQGLFWLALGTRYSTIPIKAKGRSPLMKRTRVHDGRRALQHCTGLSHQQQQQQQCPPTPPLTNHRTGNTAAVNQANNLACTSICLSVATLLAVVVIRAQRKREWLSLNFRWKSEKRLKLPKYTFHFKKYRKGHGRKTCELAETSLGTKRSEVKNAISGRYEL